MSTTTSFDGLSAWILSQTERMDTKKALWLVQGASDVNALEENGLALRDIKPSTLRKCREIFEPFPSVFIAMADAELCRVTAESLEELCPRLSVLTPSSSSFRRRKCVAEVLSEAGRNAVDRLLFEAIERPGFGLLDLADVERKDLSAMRSITSGIAELDRAIGGFYPGALSVWTGKRGGGKSTLLGQLLIEAIDQGGSVCAYSGELSSWRFKQWGMQQAAGPKFIVERQNKTTGKTFNEVVPEAAAMIDEWWRRRFFLYDNRIVGANDVDNVLKIFSFARQRHGCSVFLVDNLMTMRLPAVERDFYRAQSALAGRLVEFAKRSNVHVHLVAHPRKTGNVLEADDVSGSNDLTNRADNVFSLERLSEENARKHGFQTMLSVLKNRDYGETIRIGLNFDERSRRFYKAGMESFDRRYGWQPVQAHFTEVFTDVENPFVQ